MAVTTTQDIVPGTAPDGIVTFSTNDNIIAANTTNKVRIIATAKAMAVSSISIRRPPAFARASHHGPRQASRQIIRRAPRASHPPGLGQADRPVPAIASTRNPQPARNDPVIGLPAEQNRWLARLADIPRADAGLHRPRGGDRILRSNRTTNWTSMRHRSLRQPRFRRLRSMQ
jgi:hypothetical protein